ncbi:dienelactone hydrolase family protein [Bradyrhizobium sp. HKCCYLRH2060]|uniref:dienelactone hydrolase family protein n=1 Tax=Bradyrhizobium TaxID=374 RepID=UPI0028E1BC66|nr:MULTISPECIES: dienelactone hydrolase family protein [unclassified Bradyrhizobium]
MPTESTIKLTASDGHTFQAFRADPTDAPKGAIVVLPDGADAAGRLRKIADAFAASGYVVIAPELSPPAAIESTVEGEPAKSVPDPATPLLAEVQSTVDSVKDCGKVAVVGFGAGGGLAYDAANRVSGVACAVSYYATGVVNAAGAKRKIPTLLHFGEADIVVPFAEVTMFRAYHPEVSAFSYPNAAHAFDGNGETYDESAAALAHERTLAWISQYVVGQPPITLKNAGAYALAKTDKKKKKKADDDMGPPTD